MSTTISDFQETLGGEFVESSASERNHVAGNSRWGYVLGTIPLGMFTGPSVPVEDDLSQLYGAVIHNTNRPSTDGTDVHIHKFSLPQRNKMRRCEGRMLGDLGNASVTVDVNFTGNPVIRYFFRVRGVFETVGWGQPYVADAQEMIGGTVGYFGNMLSIQGPFTLTDSSQRIIYQDALHQSASSNLDFQREENLVVNRTAERSPLNRPGTYYFDRIVSASGVAASRVTFTLKFTASTWLNFMLNYWGGAADGRYATGSGTAETGRQVVPGAPFFWANHSLENPDSLYPGFGKMIPENGMVINSTSKTLQQLNLIEVLYIGCRAEEAVRPESTVDIVAPRLLTEF